MQRLVGFKYLIDMLSTRCFLFVFVYGILILAFGVELKRLKILICFSSICESLYFFLSFFTLLPPTKDLTPMSVRHYSAMFLVEIEDPMNELGLSRV